MSSPIRTIINNLAKSVEKSNILTFMTDPIYDYYFSTIKHNIYYWTDKYNRQEWPNNIITQPDNISIIKTSDIPAWLDIDLILVNDRTTQFLIGKELSKYWHCPLLVYHHTQPHQLVNNPEWPKILNSQGDMMIYLSQEDMDAWQGLGYMLKYGIDTEEFSLINNYNKRICITQPTDEKQIVIFKTLLNRLKLDFKIIKDLPNLHCLQQFYNNCCLYINIQYPNIPIQMLIAMSCGLPVISLDYPEIKYLLDTKYLSLSVDELCNQIQSIYENLDKAKKLGKIARSKIKQLHDRKKYIDSINNIINETKQIYYVH